MLLRWQACQFDVPEGALLLGMWQLQNAQQPFCMPAQLNAA